MQFGNLSSLKDVQSGLTSSKSGCGFSTGSNDNEENDDILIIFKKLYNSKLQ
jgi:hypothetical protein